MFIAEMETENYSWVSLGETEAEALDAIRCKWNRYQREMEKSGWINKALIFRSNDDMESEYDIRITELNAGECERY